MSTYATASDYAEFLGVDVDDWDAAEQLRIDAGLVNAADDIDGAIRLAFYDPTDAALVVALTRATCARFQFIENTGDDGSGTAGAYTSAAIGSVRLSRSTDVDTIRQAELVEKLGQRAATILVNAGFFTAGVFHA